ncbi:MAG: response regulator [Bacteroidetes bacterium]|nr:response regulator [Bacteroidota bacterium]
MDRKIKVLIVDDEILARELIKNYLSGVPGIELAGECENGFDALKAVQDIKPDLVFLDIQMPKVDGFELLEVLDHKPEIIFTTAYDQYAIKAFEHNAVDYLLKPFSKARLEQALDKARKRIAHKPASPATAIGQLQQHLDEADKIIDRVVTRMGSKIIIIPVGTIHYIEAQDDYVMVYSDAGRHLKEKTMKYFERHLPSNFIRIHRSYIVNVDQIASIELYEKDTHLVSLKDGAKLRTSQEGYKKLRDLL